MHTILICGSFRSGTSILSQMLDHHSSITLTTELMTYAPPNWSHWRNQRLRSNLLNGRQHVLEGAKVDREAFYQFFLSQGKRLTNEETIRAFFRFSTRDIRYYGDKDPWYTLQLDCAVENALKSPRIICCIRDGRDVVESQIRHHQRRMKTDGGKGAFWEKPNVTACLQTPSWFDYMQAWDDFKQSTSLDVYELYYPRMVMDASAEAKKLAQFLDVSASEMIAIFRAYFTAKHHERWKSILPTLNDELPEDFKEMLVRYGFEV